MINQLSLHPSWTFYPDNLTDISIFLFIFMVSFLYRITADFYTIVHPSWDYNDLSIRPTVMTINSIWSWIHLKLEDSLFQCWIHPMWVLEVWFSWVSVSFLSCCCSLRSQLHPELFLVMDPFCCSVCPVCSYSLLNSLFLMLIFGIPRWLKW